MLQLCCQGVYLALLLLCLCFLLFSVPLLSPLVLVLVCLLPLGGDVNARSLIESSAVTVTCFEGDRSDRAWQELLHTRPELCRTKLQYEVQAPLT